MDSLFVYVSASSSVVTNTIFVWMTKSRERLQKDSIDLHLYSIALANEKKKKIQ